MSMDIGETNINGLNDWRKWLRVNLNSESCYTKGSVKRSDNDFFISVVTLLTLLERSSSPVKTSTLMPAPRRKPYLKIEDSGLRVLRF